MSEAIVPAKAGDSQLSAPRDQNNGVAHRMRLATDAAGACKALVLQTAVTIGKRKYVPVEGWMTIAIVHGCTPTIRTVEVHSDGVRAVADIRRTEDGFVVSTGEGWVGRDEMVWYGGEAMVWNKFTNREERKVYEARSLHAIRAMAQTRAVSRACRTAFAHVVTLIGEGLMTTPAEEMDQTIDIDSEQVQEEKEKNVTGSSQQQQPPPQQHSEKESSGDQTGLQEEIQKASKALEGGKWKTVKVHYGNDEGLALGEMAATKLNWWIKNWTPKPFQGKIDPKAINLRAALDAAARETA